MHGFGSAFLLAQVGAHAARRFTERIAELDLTPAQAGLLRIVATQPGQSQQAVAAQLGTPPTRLVALVDALEKRGLVERHRNPDDRRLYALKPSKDGQALLNRIALTSLAHERTITAALTAAERATLHALLTKIADEQDLDPGYAGGQVS